MKNRGLAGKLILLILSSMLVIFGGIFGYNYFLSRQIIAEKIKEQVSTLLDATVRRIDLALLPVQKVPENLACYLETMSFESGETIKLIKSVVVSNPDVYGVGIAFEPHASGLEATHYCPYFYRSGGKIEFTYVPYDYFFWDWYQIPKELGQPAWCEPYFDEGGGNILMTTYSVPFYQNTNGKKRLVGVVATDISLEWLTKIVSSIKIGNTGYGFLITRNGTFVTHPDKSLMMNSTIFDYAETRGDENLRQIGRAMIAGKSGHGNIYSFHLKKDCLIVYAPLTSNGWSLGVVFPMDELLADITRLNQTVLVRGIIGFCLISGVIVLIAKSITRPLEALVGAAEEIAAGNLDADLPPVKSKDEVGKLTESFQAMETSLKRYIRELTETTTAKERIESELKIAHDIQMGILPRIFPAFPERPEFDIYATLVPAKEVGGDLYDYFFIDDQHLCFTVGDVSGKGVPASLFMVITRTLIKTMATPGLLPGEILNGVNQVISQDNESAMFVTLFLGILNIQTGELVYANGGHNPPYFIDNDGKLKTLETTKGMALGFVEDFAYQSAKMMITRGDSLVLYTDGVTEAVNARDELFTEKRLEDELLASEGLPIDQVVHRIMDQINSFSQGVPQFDDITLLILKYHGLP
ncbi:MAG: SpoIIE family protein phosphatase [Deltaproteobacteria bacterium]|nr:SpoIIE family protein phosphatase [Deltaproteobacteria bacterium]